VYFSGGVTNLISALTDGSLQFGYHAISFADGGSASFLSGVNTTPTPEPGTWLLLGSGLMGLVGFVRRRRSLGHREA
jgi:hypothetical protein